MEQASLTVMKYKQDSFRSLVQLKNLRELDLKEKTLLQARGKSLEVKKWELASRLEKYMRIALWIFKQKILLVIFRS